MLYQLSYTPTGGSASERIRRRRVKQEVPPFSHLFANPDSPIMVLYLVKGDGERGLAPWQITLGKPGPPAAFLSYAEAVRVRVSKGSPPC